MALNAKLDRDPVRLAIFVVHASDGRPLQRLPVYAEIVWTETEAESTASDARLAPAAARALAAADDECANDERCELRVRSALAQAFARVVSSASRDALIALGLAGQIEFLVEVLRLARAQNGGASLQQLRPEALLLVLDAALREAAGPAGMIVVSEVVALPPKLSSFPLGVLATDHAGYLSFDLERLPQAVRAVVRKAVEPSQPSQQAPSDVSATAMNVYLYGLPQFRFDVLQQRRFAHDAIVARLELEAQPVPTEIACLGFLALQNPGLTDWRLSPGSFATNPASLVGADGCESILPANVAVHEYNFHQVVAIPPREVELPLEAAAAAHVRPGFVNVYRLRLVPLGHSLGQILYSFPLAPGESVNFAIIEWTRQDVAARDEKTKVDERLAHDLRRERVIGESVKASIEEWQRGGNLMGGIAGSAGSAAGASAAQSGMGALAGVAGGIASALGGAYSTSSGSRNIAADTMQRLTENLAQAATSSRELFSTVVVQSSQAEKEAIETRTVVNYNHSHALTILYYEVQRHFLAEVSFVRRRPVLLTDVHEKLVRRRKFLNRVTLEVDKKVLVHNRAILEPALLDARFVGGFNSLEALLHRERLKRAMGTPPAPAPTGTALRYFEFSIRAGGLVAGLDKPDEVVFVTAELRIKEPPWVLRLNNGNVINDLSDFRLPDALVQMTATLPTGRTSVAWEVVDAVAVTYKLSEDLNDFSFVYLDIQGIDTSGKPQLLFRQDYEHKVVTGTITEIYPVEQPLPLPPPPGRPVQEIEEEAAVEAFMEHLEYHRAHYERALVLGASPAFRAAQLASLVVENTHTLLEKIDNRPLELLGDFVAYPCVDPEWSQRIADAWRRQQLPDPTPTERLITFPTRGVFAEAKLGHCNASEEIDNTRFWDWQSSPIPHLAPEIAPAQPVVPQAVQAAGLGASPLPAPIVSLINPPPAPDPHGMTAALTALATANIFRDMSGRAEVADLLKKLADASVQIATVAKDTAIAAKAPAAQAPASASGASGAPQSSSGGPGSNKPTQVAEPPPATGHASRAEAEKAEAGARSSQIDADKSMLDGARTYMTPSSRKAVEDSVKKRWTTTAEMMEMRLMVRHGISKQFLDGEFTVFVEGGPTVEIASITTSGGTGYDKISRLPPGEYVVSFTGVRTKLPMLKGAVVTVPRIGEREAFDITLNRYIALTGLQLSGNAKVTVPAGAQRLVLQLNALEKEYTTQQEVDYSREQGVHIQGEFSIGPKIKDFEIGSVGAGGTSIDVGTSSNKYVVTVSWTALTGGLELEKSGP